MWNEREVTWRKLEIRYSTDLSIPQASHTLHVLLNFAACDYDAALVPMVRMMGDLAEWRQC